MGVYYGCVFPVESRPQGIGECLLSQPLVNISCAPPPTVTSDNGYYSPVSIPSSCALSSSCLFGAQVHLVIRGTGAGQQTTAEGSCRNDRKPSSNDQWGVRGWAAGGVEDL